MKRQIEYEDLKKIIESCHLNFLIGSGVSSPYLSILGNIEDLLSENEFSKNPNKIIEVSLKSHYFNECVKGNLALLDREECEEDKETDFEDVCNNYKTLIDSLHTILINRKSNLVSKQVNLFTTNMDLFLDKTIEDSGYVLNDGFSGRMNPKFGTENFHNSIHKYSSHYEYKSELPLFNLFKMHGSVNWKRINQNEENSTYDISYDNNLEILRNISTVDVNDSVIPINDSNGKYEELLDAAKTIEEKQEHDVFKEKYDELVMINPTKDKFKDTTSNFYFYELLRMYANHLEKENSVLFVLGFSFADEHIREITKRVLKSNPTLLVVVFCKKDNVTKFQEYFNSINNLICVTPEDDNHYKLDKANSFLFEELAHELNFGLTKSKQEEQSIKTENNAK